jgi:hypothetical protein
MKFMIGNAIELLERTPDAISTMLDGLSEAWTSGGGREDWSPFDIVGHLIHGERTDWIPRARIILDQGGDRTFVPFDRHAQFRESQIKSLADLLKEFAVLRAANLKTLRKWDLTPEQLALHGVHPELGDVTLAQLIATWVVHDLNHISQITRKMAVRYSENVGVWKEYLSILS